MRPLPLLALAALSLAALGCGDGAPDGADRDAATAGTLGDATQTICADGSDTLCSTLPTDLAGVGVMIGYVPASDAGGTGAFNQTFLDYFGWQSFVALNWPLGDDGQPSSGSITSDPDAPRVWTTFDTVDEVFGSGTTALAGAGACPAGEGDLQLYRTSKFGLAGFLESATPWPLIDRNGNYALYDVRLNSREVAYLQTNGLTTQAGQTAFRGSGGTYAFPGGQGAEAGAIEIKTSWRVLTDGDDPSDYYTTSAVITVPAAYSETGEQLCLHETVGLVGMHIMQKFSAPDAFAPFWAWATFEHVDNAPLADGAPVSPTNGASTVTSADRVSCSLPPDTTSTTRYSFYNPSCRVSVGAVCGLNNPPPMPADSVYKWAPTKPYARASMIEGPGGPYGTQAARCFDIYESARTVTAAYQSALAGSPFANYMLVGVQWASASSTATGPFQNLSPFPAPIYLTNTTMETYIQTDPVFGGNFNQGSCIACHAQATDRAGNASNLSFLPFHAQ